MYISSIEARALKGLSFSHPLTPCTLLSGANFAGKTTRLQAIQLAILGYLPGLKKTDKEPIAGSEVKITFDNGDWLSRAWPIEGGAVKEVADSSMDEEEILALATPTLDSDLYFSKTAGESVKYIFTIMKLPDTHTVDGIVSEMMESMFPDCDPNHVQTARAEVRQTVTATLTENGIAEGLGLLTGAKGLIDKELTLWNRTVKDKQGTVKTLAELRTREGECSADILADLKERQAEIAKDLAAANVEAGGLNERRLAFTRTLERRQEIEAKLAAPPVDHADQIAGLRAAIEKDKAAIAAPVDMTPLDYRADNAHSELLMARHSLAMIEKRVAEAAAELVELNGLCECPWCKSKAKGWKSRVLPVMEADLEEAKAAHEELVPKVQALEKTWEEVCAEIKKCAGDALANRLAQESIARNERTVERLTETQAVDHRNRKLLTESLEALTAEGNPTDEELAGCLSAGLQLQTKADALKARIETATKLQQDIKRAAEAEQEHAKAKAFAAVYNDAKKKLKARQEDTIDVLFKGLMETANFFTKGILRTPLIFRDGVVGTVRGTTFVSVSHFSGTERAVTFIAIAAALAADSPFKLAILDEMGRLDSGNKIKVMERLQQAVEKGIIEQAIAIDTQVTQVDGWNYISL